MPSARILTASHTDALVLDLANKARSVIKSEKYQKCFPNVVLRSDQDTKGYYINTSGGDRYTCTVAGKTPMGFHAHFLITDDPLDPKRVISEAERKTAKEFIESIIPTRKVDKSVAVSILVMQRLGVGDPTDVMIDMAKKEGANKVRQICLPAELEKSADGSYVSDNVIPPELFEKYIDGLMDPVRLDRQVLTEYKARGNLFYSSQFLQKPFSASGGLFKVQYFNQRVRAAPFECRRIRFWDRAATAGGGCRTAGVLMARDNEGNFYVEHVVIGQWEPNERNQIMRATALRDRNKYGPSYEPKVVIEREGGSSGRDAWKAVARVLSGFPVYEESVTGSKVTRAEPWAAQLAALNVYVVEDGTWDIKNYIEEHVSFPFGSYLDQVDASSGAFNIVAATRIDHRIFVLGAKNKKDKGLQFVVIKEGELKDFTTDKRALLIFVTRTDEDETEIPPHAMSSLLDSMIIQFDDIHPKDVQKTWEESNAAKRIVTRDHAKRLWWFIMRTRMPQPEIIVVVDSTDSRRARSLAMSLSDGFNRPRNSIYELSGDSSYDEKTIPPNPHVYEVLKYGKNLIVA
mgnify:FL=1